MKLILLQDVDNLGEEGDIVTVKDGYGRNYLIPQRMARLASEGAVRQRREEERQAARKVARKRDEAEALAKQLSDTEVVVTAKMGEDDRIHGSVTSQQLAVELAKRGFDVDRRDIELTEEIRMIGVYTANVKVFKDVVGHVKVRVMPESGETI